MFYGASPQIFQNAKELRNNMTQSESKLWEKLNKKQFLGLRFRRQHPIGSYIADFYCHKLNMVIELDGGIHESPDQKEYDSGRAFDMKELGLTVIRFKNDEINDNIDEVLKRIGEYVQQKLI